VVVYFLLLNNYSAVKLCYKIFLTSSWFSRGQNYLHFPWNTHGARTPPTRAFMYTKHKILAECEMPSSIIHEHVV